MGHITYNSEGEIPMRFMLIAKATKESEAGLPPDSKLIAAIGKLSEIWPRPACWWMSAGCSPAPEAHGSNCQAVR
jgi:hypothetical protein